MSAENARTLRFLKTLVTVLTLTMIGGVLTITALLVIRLQTPAVPSWPEAVVLPDGVTATAVTRGDGWYAVVTDDQRILIYGADGALLQDIPVTGP